MKYNFDALINRENTSCIKWDFLEAFFGQDRLHPMWVADMDFQTPPEILIPMQERVSHGVFGYTAKSDEFYNSVITWFKKRYNWSIRKSWIVTTPGVVPALNLMIQEFTKEGDGIIIQSPVYFPFKDSILINNRKLLDNQLVLKNGHYEIDWQNLETCAKSAKMIVLCSPHNPVSRVWTIQELNRLSELCKKYDLLVFSDEIHADIIFKPHKHITTASVNKDLANRTISAFATSKTFNLAGLQLSVNIIPNKKIRDRFNKSLEKLHLNMSNIFGITGTQAAYTHGEQWLDKLLPYLWQNYVFVKTYLEEHIPEITAIEPEGTFLLWLDCRKLGLNDEELSAFFVQKANLALTNGIMFGPGGSGFMRMNIGCPRQSVLKGMVNLKKAMNDNSTIQSPAKQNSPPKDC